MLKVRKDFFEYVIFAILLIITLYFLIGAFSSGLTYKFVVIDNADPNSMYPTYQQGDIFIIKKLAPNAYSLGDVIVYQPRGNNGLIIHRIIDKYLVDGTYYYQVKGDDPVTNALPDPFGEKINFINADQILGKTTVKIPFLGHYSLAIQRNTAFQLTMLAIGIAFAISVFTSKEEEKEKEYYELSKSTALQLQTTVKMFFKSSKGKASVGIAVLLLIIILVQLLTPGVFYQSANAPETGLVYYNIKNTPVRHSTVFNDGTTVDTVFYQVWITLYDAGYFTKRVNSFSIDVMSPSNKVVSHTLWIKLGDMVGKFSVGGSILLHSTDMDLSIAQDLTVKITVNFTGGSDAQIVTTVLHYTTE